jgi:sulfotransferase family protein
MAMRERLETAMPRSAKRRMREVARSVGRATSQLRLEPSYVVIGEARCGTTSLYRYLTGHPLVGRALTKEVHYFSIYHSLGWSWYQGHFPTAAYARLVGRRLGGTMITGEASPYYLFHPLAAERIKAELPAAKIIAIFRDPVERAASKHRHQTALGAETLSFEDALDAEPERLAGEEERIMADPTYPGFNHRCFSYASRGFYADTLQRYYDLFPKEQIMVIGAEEMFEKPDLVLADLLQFLELPQWRPATFPRHNATRSTTILPETAARLRRLYAEPNRRLEELTGRSFGWGIDTG